MKTSLLFLLFVCCQYIIAQQVVATSGNTLTNSNGSISYTVGESVTQTFSNGNTTLTQGFQQPNYSITTVVELKELNFAITAFPNPTTEMLVLKIEGENFKGLKFILLDMLGKPILQNNLESAETIIPVSKLSAGTYFIKVLSDKRELKIFKILKN